MNRFNPIETDHNGASYGCVECRPQGDYVKYEDMQKMVDNIVDYLASSCCLDAMGDLFVLIENEGFKVKDE